MKPLNSETACGCETNSETTAGRTLRTSKKLKNSNSSILVLRTQICSSLKVSQGISRSMSNPGPHRHRLDTPGTLSARLGQIVHRYTGSSSAQVFQVKFKQFMLCHKLSEVMVASYKNSRGQMYDVFQTSTFCPHAFKKIITTLSGFLDQAEPVRTPRSKLNVPFYISRLQKCETAETTMNIYE